MTRCYGVYGAGGVGKTTTAAALGVALARRGSRTLVVTTDPARRLADVLGVTPAPAVAAVPWCDQLDCLMPHARTTTRALAGELLADHPDLLDSLLANPVFEALLSGIAGIHELAALASLASMMGNYDAVVIDTAPGVHAMQLLALPGQIAALLDGRALRWLIRLAPRSPAVPRGVASRLLDWGQRAVVARLQDTLGAAAVVACLDVLAAVTLLRPRLSEIARVVNDLLFAPSTSHVLVVAPRSSARREIDYISGQLATLGVAPCLYVINRAATETPAWLTELSTVEGLPDELACCIRSASGEFDDARRATVSIVDEVTRMARPAIIVRVPTIVSGNPPDIVIAAAHALASAVTAP